MATQTATIPTVKPPEEERFATFAFEFQVDGDSKLDEGEFEGMAVNFDSPIDAFLPTVIKAGAFKKTLRESGDRVRILWAHRRDMMIGFPTELRETKDGVYVKAKLVAEGKGAEALALLRLAREIGKKVDLSIGVEMIRFEILRDKKTGEPEQRIVSEAKINEVSLVFMGADSEAGVTEVNQKPEGSQALQNQLVNLQASIGALLSGLDAESNEGQKSDSSESQSADAGSNATSAEADAGDGLSTSAQGDEEFAGRVLSKKNVARIKEIISQLQGLVPSDDDGAGEKNRHPDKSKDGKPKDEKQEVPDRLSLLNEAELQNAETSSRVQEVLG